MMLLTIFLVSFFVSNSYDIGVTVTQIDKTIWTIYQDKKSNYWFGSKENGVFYYNGQQIRQITVKDGLVSNEIRGFQEDSVGNIFIETRNNPKCTRERRSFYRMGRGTQLHGIP